MKLSVQTHLVWIPARLAPYRFGRARRWLQQKVQRALVSDVSLKLDEETFPFRFPLPLRPFQIDGTPFQKDSRDSHARIRIYELARRRVERDFRKERPTKFLSFSPSFYPED